MSGVSFLMHHQKIAVHSRYHMIDKTEKICYTIM